MAWGYGEVDNATVRDLVTAATGGQEVRIRISNYFGNAPLVIGAANIAPSAGGSAIVDAQVHDLTFGGKTQVIIPPGQLIYSDPVPMAVSGGETLAVSLFVADSDLVSVHPCCSATASFFTRNGAGDMVGEPSLLGLATPSPWPRFVDALDALQTTGRGSIVVLGDSITDGFNSTLRWTDVLQRRIDALPLSQQRAVVNEGITANALTSYVHTDALTGGGPSGVSRLYRDVLSQAGVSEVVVLLGTNDIWFGATADEVISGYEQVIDEAQAMGVRVVGMTLLPRETSRSEFWSATNQSYLEQVDRWIATSGAFDGYINSEWAVADHFDGQCQPWTMYLPFDSGDHLHPNAAGDVALANAIDPAVLDLPAALPTVAPLVAATPTPGCQSPIP